MVSSTGKKDEIDLIEFIQIIWFNKKKIVIAFIIFPVITLGYSFLVEKEYTADTVFIPQSQSGETSLKGNLGGLASLAGIQLGSMNSNEDNFPPTLYPSLLDNIEIQYKLLNSNIFVEENGDSVSYIDFYENVYRPGFSQILKQYTIGLPGKLLSLLRKAPVKNKGVQQGRFYELSAEEYKHIKRLKGSISIDPDIQEGFVTLRFTMNNPKHAAQMAGHLEKIIHDELIDYRIDKVNQNINYLEEIEDNRRKEFLEAQNALSKFKDQNVVLSSSKAKDVLQRLENEYNIAFDIYKQVAVSLEQKRLERAKNIPLIKTIKPIVVPIEKTGPNRIAYIFIGLLLAAVTILYSLFLKPKIKSIKTNNP